MMKKLFLILVLTIPVLAASAQLNIADANKYWNETFTISEALSDSVFFPEGTGNIAGYKWSCTVSAENLSNPIVIDFGGSNYDLSTTKLDYGFVGFECDSLPYTFDPATNVVTTHGVDVVMHHFWSGTPYNSIRPAFKLTTTTDTDFTLTVNWVFYK